MYIERITIKKFRSIAEETFNAKNLTVFVGRNDAGKSNILKALNLFFNNETDLGQSFDFETDYSRFAVKQKKKAQEISIEIIFSPPDTFRDHSKRISWTKKWRKDGFYTPGEKIVFADGSQITDRSRVSVWLRRLRYHYVPAIKGNDYFSSLLKSLYRTLYATIKTDLQKAGQAFVGNIREHTKLLSGELSKKLNLDSKIQLPEDLSNLFSTLDFETVSKGQSIALKHRGDGIKVRHLPVILKFLAEKERIHHSKGAVRSDTIWGYEEPENNLELHYAFELAKDFEKYSEDVQIFLTTHSPAFYTIGKGHSNTLKYASFKDAENSSTRIKSVDENNIKEIDEAMGLLPIIGPYVEEKISENQELRKIIADLKDETKPVLFVEGKTDKTILENAWKRLKGKDVMPFRIQPAFDRYFIGNTFRRGEIFKNNNDLIFIGLFDFDEAFENWERLLELKQNNLKMWEFAEKEETKGLRLKHRNHAAHVFLLPVPAHRKEYANKNYGRMSALSIELLFEDDKLTSFVEEKDVLGGGKILKMKDAKKVAFANSTKQFSKKDFSCFSSIFAVIDSIIKEKTA